MLMSLRGVARPSVSKRQVPNTTLHWSSFVTLTCIAMLPVPSVTISDDRDPSSSSSTRPSSSSPQAIALLWKPLPIELVATESGKNLQNRPGNNSKNLLSQAK